MSANPPAAHVVCTHCSCWRAGLRAYYGHRVAEVCPIGGSSHAGYAVINFGLKFVFLSLSAEAHADSYLEYISHVYFPFSKDFANANFTTVPLNRYRECPAPFNNMQKLSDCEAAVTSLLSSGFGTVSEKDKAATANVTVWWRPAVDGGGHCMMQMYDPDSGDVQDVWWRPNITSGSETESLATLTRKNGTDTWAHVVAKKAAKGTFWEQSQGERSGIHSVSTRQTIFNQNRLVCECQTTTAKVMQRFSADTAPLKLSNIYCKDSDPVLSIQTFMVEVCGGALILFHHGFLAVFFGRKLMLAGSCFEMPATEAV